MLGKLGSKIFLIEKTVPELHDLLLAAYWISLLSTVNIFRMTTDHIKSF